MFVLSPEMEAHIKGLSGPIAVIGAGGFIGANLMHTLFPFRNDCFAVTHQNYVPWRLHGLPSENVVRCDITRNDEVKRLFHRYPFRTIFAFAAYGAYSRQAEADRIYQTNLLGLINVIEAAQKSGFSALVHAGSSSEYGINCAAPAETSALLPNSHYAVSKVAVHHLLKYLGNQQQLPVMNLRFYSVYGPWEEPDRLISRLLQCALKGSLPPLVNPEISRDFLYVQDAVEASILAAAHGVQTHPGESVNVGTGTQTTIRELVIAARSLFNIEEQPRWGTMANRAWDLKEWYADPRFAETVLGWKAKTSLLHGLRQTYEWIYENGAGPRAAAPVALQEPARLSAVIACYQDGKAIPLMHERLTKTFRDLKVDYEIIFVNDASPDGTDEILRNVCGNDDHVIAIEHSRNFGSQNAFLSGMAIATGDAVILLDGDLQDPPELISEFHTEWIKGAEVVYGRRVRREASFLLQFCYKAFYRLLRKMAYISIPVDAGDFSLIDRRVVDQLLRLPESDQFLRGLRAWVGFKQVGVDYIRPERMFGRTTNNWRKNFWWARKAIFSFSFAPMEMLLYAGIGLTGLSFLALIGQVALRLIDPSIPHGIPTIIVLILFFGGINMLGISILGEYIGKVFDETKRRPHFIRRSIRFAAQHLASTETMEAFIHSRKRRTILGDGNGV